MITALLAWLFIPRFSKPAEVYAYKHLWCDDEIDGSESWKGDGAEAVSLTDRCWWVKFVGFERPFTDDPGDVVGPFRSEIDCDEFIAACNGAMKSKDE